MWMKSTKGNSRMVQRWWRWWRSPADVRASLYKGLRGRARTFIILEALSVMSQLHLHLLFYLAASASCFSLPPDLRVRLDKKDCLHWNNSTKLICPILGLTNLCLYFQKFPIEEGSPDYEIVEITPNELEAIVNIQNPAADNLMYPAEYFEVLEGNK